MKKKRGKRQVCASTLFLPFMYILTHLVISETIAKIFFGGVGNKIIQNDQTQGCLSGLGWGRGSAESEDLLKIQDEELRPSKHSR